MAEIVIIQKKREKTKQIVCLTYTKILIISTLHFFVLVNYKLIRLIEWLKFENSTVQL